DAETISRLIKERITPYPSFVLAPERESGKDILVLSVSSGRSTPYYYKADGIMEAYIRMGNESVIAPSYVLNQLILKGMHRTYDELISEYDFKDYAFSKLRERYKAWTGQQHGRKAVRFLRYAGRTRQADQCRRLACRRFSHPAFPPVLHTLERP
ncbi:divergent AAA domain protein, partial [human gut metagenome]